MAEGSDKGLGVMGREGKGLSRGWRESEKRGKER